VLQCMLIELCRSDTPACGTDDYPPTVVSHISVGYSICLDACSCSRGSVSVPALDCCNHGQCAMLQLSGGVASM
jgi:hypothetical protein